MEQVSVNSIFRKATLRNAEVAVNYYKIQNRQKLRIEQKKNPGLHKLRPPFIFLKKKIHLGKKLCFFLTQKLLKVTISITKNRTKNIIYAKNERQVNSKLPCKCGHFLKQVEFLGRHLGVFGCL